MPNEVTPLINFGVVGCILAWFMFKQEPRLKALEEAIDRNTQTIAMFILALETAPPIVKQHMELMLKEIEQARIERTK